MRTLIFSVLFILGYNARAQNKDIREYVRTGIEVTDTMIYMQYNKELHRFDTFMISFPLKREVVQMKIEYMADTPIYKYYPIRIKSIPDKKYIKPKK